LGVRSEETVATPICLKDKGIRREINRSRKQITAFIHIAAAGDLLPLYMVIASKLNTNFWKKAGLIRRKGIVIVENAKPYINASPFEDFVTRIPLTYLTNPRRNPVLVGQRLFY
jgi:ribosomal protein L36